jgi:hypothetical protein
MSDEEGWRPAVLMGVLPNPEVMQKAKRRNCDAGYYYRFVSKLGDVVQTRPLKFESLASGVAHPLNHAIAT